VTPLSWRVLVDPPQDGAENMARDEALASDLEDGHGVLRLYSWARPTISFGRNEPARIRWQEARDRGDVDLATVRRPTGGRAVLHDAEVTYAVIIPQRALGGPRSAYVSINRALAAGLQSLGAEVSVVDASIAAAPLPPDAGPCFQTPVAGELVARGRKLVGSAQARIGATLLQHGSIILSGDQGALSQLDPTAAPVDRPATLEELIGPIGFDDVVEAVVGASVEVFGGSWERSSWSPAEVRAVARLRAERYDLEEWTFRR